MQSAESYIWPCRNCRSFRGHVCQTWALNLSRYLNWPLGGAKRACSQKYIKEIKETQHILGTKAISTRKRDRRDVLKGCDKQHDIKLHNVRTASSSSSLLFVLFHATYARTLSDRQQTFLQLSLTARSLMFNVLPRIILSHLDMYGHHDQSGLWTRSSAQPAGFTGSHWKTKNINSNLSAVWDILLHFLEHYLYP